MGTDTTVAAVNRNESEYQRRIVWFNIFSFSAMHLAALYGLYLALTSARVYTFLYAFLLSQLAGFGITAGAHRLWSHRAYKATWQLQLILMVLNTLAFQGHVIEWSRDHRLHHKYSETDADPHNAKRGFFFAHVGWLLCKKHPQVLIKGKGLSVQDLQNNPFLAFQKKYYYFILMPIICFILPPLVPVYLWNETWQNAIFVADILRYIYSLNMTFLVNSAAHIYGEKPYDKSISPSENKTVALLAMGEGWHNYHHVFPWDYKTAELGNYELNFTTAFIDFFARIGWAYDLEKVSAKDIAARVLRTGDGTHNVWAKNE